MADPNPSTKKRTAATNNETRRRHLNDYRRNYLVTPLVEQSKNKPNKYCTEARKKMSVSGYTCIRLVFCWVNILFWISGCGLLGVGLWLRVAYEGYASLLPQYTILSADSLVITFGTITFFVSFLACCGSWFQNRCMLITYFSFVVVIFVAELFVASLAFIVGGNFENTLREELRNGIEHHYNVTTNVPNSLVDIWDSIQTKFRCCGVTSYEDWYMIDAWPDKMWVPDSCCLPASYDKHCGKIRSSRKYTHGCYALIYNFLVKRLDIIGFIAILIAFVQLYGLISSMLVFCIMKHKKKTRTYKSYT